jgi:hypothetical protein
MKLGKLVTVFTIAMSLLDFSANAAPARHTARVTARPQTVCSNPTSSIEASELPGFFVLNMGVHTKAWFNANEVKAFHTPARGTAFVCAGTEIVVHDDHYFVREKPDEVAKKLAQALGVDELVGYAVLTMGNGTPGWFNAGEVMAFYSAIKGISVTAVQTEMMVHGYRVWLQETPEAVVEKLRVARAQLDTAKP